MDGWMDGYTPPPQKFEESINFIHQWLDRLEAAQEECGAKRFWLDSPAKKRNVEKNCTISVSGLRDMVILILLRHF